MWLFQFPLSPAVYESITHIILGEFDILLLWKNHYLWQYFLTKLYFSDISIHTTSTFFWLVSSSYISFHSFIFNFLCADLSSVSFENCILLDFVY